jgi:hypothetical protein
MLEYIRKMGRQVRLQAGRVGNRPFVAVFTPHRFALLWFASNCATILPEKNFRCQVWVIIANRKFSKCSKTLRDWFLVCRLRV